MSTLTVPAAVPNGMYRILPASNQTLALELQDDSNDIRVVGVDEFSEGQKVSALCVA